MLPLVVTLRGHLTVSSLERELAPLEALLRSGHRALIVDASQMTSYDDEARSQFVAWNRLYKDRIGRVAIVTDRLMWRMVISAMSLAAQQEMQAFASLDHARVWASRDRESGELNQVQIVTGRLIEVCVRSLAPSELLRLVREISAARSRMAQGGVVAIADLRSLASLSELSLARATKLLPTWNPGLLRVALLLPAQAGAMGLQLQRILDTAGSPKRRLFYDPAEAEAWLCEVLTEPERARLSAFLRQT